MRCRGLSGAEAEWQAAARALRERPRMWQRQRAGWRGRTEFRRFAPLERAREQLDLLRVTRRAAAGTWAIGVLDEVSRSPSDSGAAEPRPPTTVPNARTRRGVRGMYGLRCDWLRRGRGSSLFG